MNPRVTSTMVGRTVLADSARAAERLAQTQRKLSSGKELTRPADDPYAVSRAISLRSELAGAQQHQRNVQEAISWQEVTDGALGTVGEAVQRARELVIRGATDTSSAVDRAALAAEIDQLVETVKQQANATYGNRYVMAGTATTTRPYALAGADTYLGDGGTVAREIGPGVSLGINVRADDILGSGQASGDGRLLDALRDVADHLRGGTPADVAALRSTDIQAMDRNLDELNRVRAVVGAGTNRLLSAADRLAQVEETTIRLLSDVEDADMAKGMVDFSIQHAAYEAALKAGARIVQTSLLDFLR